MATFVHGRINLTHFRFGTEYDIPEVIGTTETPKNYFNSIGKQQPVENRTEEDPKGTLIRKVFSRSDLTDSQLNELFSRVNEVKVVSWLAYPHFTHPEKFWSFVLDDGIFYINAIEHSASFKNAALLAHQYYTGKVSNVPPQNSSSNTTPKGEL